MYVYAYRIQTQDQEAFHGLQGKLGPGLCKCSRFRPLLRRPALLVCFHLASPSLSNMEVRLWVEQIYDNTIPHYDWGVDTTLFAVHILDLYKAAAGSEHVCLVY